jgi:hypothetical protein
MAANKRSFCTSARAQPPPATKVRPISSRKAGSMRGVFVFMCVFLKAPSTHRPTQDHNRRQKAGRARVAPAGPGSDHNAFISAGVGACGATQKRTSAGEER